MKILLHSPCHPSYWVYLMECLPEHQWFIEDKDDFEEGQIPRKHVWYNIVSKDCKMSFDVQIVFLPQFLDHNKLSKLLKDFPIPPVFVEIAGYSLPNLKGYPLISGTTYCSNSQYSNIRYSYVPPSQILWNKEWQGDIPKVFIPAQRYLEPEYAHSKMAQIVPLLKNAGISLDIATGKRTMSFNQWQDKFIHNRVLLDCTQKYASFIVEEAMMVGMPIVAIDNYETGIMVRDNIDGFTNWSNLHGVHSNDALIELLQRFTTDKRFADKWSIASKARGKDILDPNKTAKIFNQAIVDAITIGVIR